MNKDKKEIIKKIIIDFEPEKISLVRRDLSIPFNSSLIISLIGPRKAGKTYFLYQIIQDLLKKGLKKEQIVYINFEDERLLPLTKDDADLILEAYFELYPSFDKKIFFFFDEIQNLPFWPNFLRRISQKHSIFITGSSSKLLSFEIATALRGKTLSFYLHPFSFKEFLRYKKITLEKNFSYHKQRFILKKLFLEYINFGGLPVIFDLEENFKIKYLQEYLNLVTYKDIIERYQIKNSSFFKELEKNLILETSNFFSLSSYFKTLKNLGFSIGKDTLFQYFSYIEEINLINTSSFFSKSKKSQLVNPKKIYVFDTGLYKALSFEEEKGKLLETAVFNYLKQKNFETYYYKKENEVDIIAKKEKMIIPIQVCYSLKNQKTKEREIKGLINFAKNFKVNKGLIITFDEESEIEEKSFLIKVIPAWKTMVKEEID